MTSGPSDVSRETLPLEVVALFGDALPRLEQFHDLLAEQGELRGLIGPAEVGRLWERHIVNCAAVSELLPVASTVVDVGSGAGLPGIVVACMRPGVHFELVEPMARRVEWLEECREALELTNVTVTRARAQELSRQADVVISRAVAPLEKLVRWCVPLLRPGGTMLAMKGARAQTELDSAAGVLRKLRVKESSVAVAGPYGSWPGATAVLVTTAS